MNEFNEIAGLRAQNQSLLRQLRSKQSHLNSSFQVCPSLMSQYKPAIYKSIESPVRINNQVKQYKMTPNVQKKMFYSPVSYNTRARTRDSHHGDPELDISAVPSMRDGQAGHVSFGDTMYQSADSNNRVRRPSMTSTPARQKLTSLCKETPKSILKKRKIIDDNVKVMSKFDHDWDRLKRSRSDLNYSYSNAGNGLANSTATEPYNRTLLDDLNNIKNRSVHVNNQTQSSKRTPSKVIQKPMENSIFSHPSENRPLLGYDWIAGVLDTTNNVTDQSESFFREIQDFRRVNREECISKTMPFQLSLPVDNQTLSPDIPSADHQCIHTYTVNPRLFTVPLNANSKGDSRCPICHKSRSTKPTTESPSYVRVSIPRSTLLTPYRVRPHRRKSFDPSDSCALSQHCLAGWETSRPAQLPMASNVDLRTTSKGIRGKLATTLSEAEDLTLGSVLGKNKTGLHRRLYHPTALSRPSFLKDSQNLTLDNNTAVGLSGSHSRQTTDQLLNTSRQIDFDLQQRKFGP